MLKENKNTEKKCLFFVSDYHFEMISLPYISKNLKNNKKVMMITENDLTKSVNKLLSRVNLSNAEKDEINKIDWKNSDINKINEIGKNRKESNETVIFIKGGENYINEINKNINECNNTNGIEIIDCYDINHINCEIDEIAKRYDSILTTSAK